MSDHTPHTQRHIERANEQLAHEAAKWILHEASTQSLITVTRAATRARGTLATVYVSIFPEDQIRPALAFLQRSERDFNTHVRTHTRIRPAPTVNFLLEDGSVSNAPPVDASAPSS